MIPVNFYKDKTTGEVILSLDNETDTNLEVLKANTVDASKEKHVPIVKVDGNKVTVQVGSVLHPMSDAHLITMITLVTDRKAIRRNLTPTDEPVAEFNLVDGEKVETCYEYCNLHGLWKIDL